MNFLAHCALADLTEETDHGVIAGGVLADFHRGAVPDDWPNALQLGVRLHRRIDAFSNTHPAIAASCGRFPAHLRRLAPIFVDIHADRSLSRAWASYHPEALTDFAQRCYQAIEHADPHGRGLPAAALRFLSYMQEEDLLSNYAEWRHMQRGVASVQRRLKRPVDVDEVVDTLRRLDGDLAQDFADYFPDLIAEARTFTAGQ